MAALQGVGSRRSKQVFAGSVYGGLIAMTAVFLFPLLWILGLSLKTRLQVFAVPPLFVTTQRYSPSSASFAWAIVYVALVAPAIGSLPFCH